MTVIIIEEESHGGIGVAKDIESAFQYLVDTKWITENTQFFEPNPDCPDEFHYLGDIMKDLDRNIVDTLVFLWECDPEYFDGSFYFTVADVYGT